MQDDEGMRNMNTKEIRLLLYFETQAVDYGGTLQNARMNAEDFEIAKRWNESGFVQFGRIAASDIPNESYESPRTHWCVLSADAWEAAHAERYARCQRKMDALTVQRIGLTD